MEKSYEYIVILAIGIAGLILVPASQQVSAIKIDGLWKLNANNEKGDLIIHVTPETPSSLNKDKDSGLITGTIHWFGNPPVGGDSPYTTNVIGFWDNQAGKIVFLSENKIVFDKSRPTENCNTVQVPNSSTKDELVKQLGLIDGRDAKYRDKVNAVLDMLIPCHGRDVGFTGYLLGSLNDTLGIKPASWVMAGVQQHYGGGSTGAGASAVRNTFGWCATLNVDMCGTPMAKASAMSATAMNATAMSNTTATAK